MKIVFHGANAANFSVGFAAMLTGEHEITVVSDGLDQPGERQAYEQAEVIIGIRLGAAEPTPRALRLYHAPAAGTDAVDVARLPAGVPLCNCFGHEHAIAEYVMTALLMRHVPIADADARLRRSAWTYWAGTPGAMRTELGSQTIGLLGFGHIGKAIAVRAKAFGMRVTVANRSPVAVGPLADQAFGLDQMADFMASADHIVVSLPLMPATTGIVNAAALAAMRPAATIVNVGRGPVIDEQALYDVLAARRIGGAIIDTWYKYPTPAEQNVRPASLPFWDLDNVVLTPHMSGWTNGTVRRRQQTMADNIARLASGQALENIVARGI